jgi:hypothetical protein
MSFDSPKKLVTLTPIQGNLEHIVCTDCIDTGDGFDMVVSNSQGKKRFVYKHLLSHPPVITDWPPKTAATVLSQLATRADELLGASATVMIDWADWYRGVSVCEVTVKRRSKWHEFPVRVRASHNESRSGGLTGASLNIILGQSSGLRRPKDGIIEGETHRDYNWLDEIWLARDPSAPDSIDGAIRMAVTLATSEYRVRSLYFGTYRSASYIERMIDDTWVTVATDRTGKSRWFRRQSEVIHYNNQGSAK